MNRLIYCVLLIKIVSCLRNKETDTTKNSQTKEFINFFIKDVLKKDTIILMDKEIKISA